MAEDRLLEVLAAAEWVALQDVLDAAVESLRHAVRFGPCRRGQAMRDWERGTEPVELAGASGRAASEAEQAVGDFPAVVGEHAGDPQGP